jgi:predicted RNA binding protein with dsRBD fold (UPF0201 family)
MKAALQNAAFFILALLAFTSATARPMAETLDGVRKKASAMLLQKQKKQALQTLTEFIRNETNKTTATDALDFLEMIAKTFITKESQEAYETSVNLIVENPKEAVKQVDLCIQAEPQNSECLVQRIRLAYRDKNIGVVENYSSQLKQIIPGTRTDHWVSITLKRTDLDFKNKIIVKKLNEKVSEDSFVFAALELDRSFAAKNFSRAKEVLGYLEKHFSDWPDIIFYKSKLEVESAEEKSAQSNEAFALYSAKCKNLSKSIARKYRYDFDLCKRGMK